MGRLRRTAAFLAAGALVLGACTDDDDDGDDAATTTEAAGGTGGDTANGEGGSGDTLDAVLEAGQIRCGTRDELPGFAVLDPATGDHVGFDVDFCRVIAAAVLGDAEDVEFVDLETDDRFTALQAGEIDVLVRNTTWTATRDGAEGATFLQPNFYDGQGMMVAADSGFTTLEDLAGAVVCVAGGTTTEGNVATEFARLGLAIPEVLPFDSPDLIQAAFQEDRCDGWSSDLSQLTGLRSAYPDGPEALRIFPDTFSKEPLAPAVRDGDSQWAQVVNWAVMATIQAEEFGLTSENVDQMLAETDNPLIRQFLGEAGEDAVLDPGLGLPADFAYQVVSQVGSYGEIYEEHIAPLGLERGLNSLWTEGGLLYAMPYR
ncbi:MAG: amino acid ABC transporter substrate-binding protein [Acidimicrobiales bacterium]